MGRRLPKKGHQSKTRTSAPAPDAPERELPVTKPTTRDTITAVVFFGFPASVFTADLARTGVATLIVLALLGAITLVAR